MSRATKQFDVTVIGAGLAGLQCARLLAQRGLSVLLADRKTSLTSSIHTTGIFVRKTLEDFDLPEDCLGPVVRRVVLYSPRRRAITFTSPADEFRTGRMPRLYERYLKRCISAGVSWLPGARYVEYKTSEDQLLVRFEGEAASQWVRTRYLVGADGAASRVAQSLGLDANHEWIVGLEQVWTGIPLDGPPCFHCFLDPVLAPGYLAWFVHDGEEAHLGVGGYPSRFDPVKALETFRASLSSSFDFRSARIIERRAGRIPVNGILPRIANKHGLLIGDAAGAVSPLTAGGLDPCLRLSTFAATVIDDYLRTNNPAVLLVYSGEQFRARFVSRLWMRRLIATFNQPALVEIACALLRLPILNSIAWQIFFGRRSFPDPGPNSDSPAFVLHA